METFEAIKNRRSIRKFLNKRVSADLLEELIEAARLAPSAMNLQPLEYIIVNREDLLLKLFDCTEWKNYSFASGPERGEEPKAYIVILSNTLIKSRNIEMDAGLAIENILLLAQSEGLASCCLGSVSWGQINRLLGIPNSHYGLLLIALGYPKQSASFVDSDDRKIRSVDEKIIVSKNPLEKIIHKNYF